MHTPRGIDQQIAAIAKSQHGLIRRCQLSVLGMSDDGIRHRVGIGRLHRISPGVFAVGHGDLSERGELLACVMAVGPEAALSGMHAARLWGIWKRVVPERVVVVAAHHHRSRAGIKVRRCRNLHPRDVTRRFGIPVTSVSRTILELGDELTPWQLANVIHEAEFRKLFRERELLRLLDRHRGRAAVTVVREALAIRASGSWGSLSDLEDQFLARAHARGLEPQVNVAVAVVDGTVRPDLWWPEAGLAVEVDGGGHARERTRREDRGRAAQLREVGHVVLRCGPGTMDECLDQVERLLSRSFAPA